MEAIDAHKDEHDDVNFLSTYPPLLAALEDAMNGVVRSHGIGLGRWVFESNIRDVPEVTTPLSQFELHRDGWVFPWNLRTSILDGLTTGSPYEFLVGQLMKSQVTLDCAKFHAYSEEGFCDFVAGVSLKNCSLRVERLRGHCFIDYLDKASATYVRADVKWPRLPSIFNSAWELSDILRLIAQSLKNDRKVDA
jgi:hypothetical protein